MVQNSSLAITIPTYNRADILKQNLLYMLEEIKKFHIPIYISDDSTNDETKNMISDLKKEYPYIYYVKNEPSLGHDKNCFRTLNLPKEDYIWYLGDSIFIEHGGLNYVIEHAQTKKYDFIIANRNNINSSMPSKLFSDPKVVFMELSWYLTLTGATIYKKEILENFHIRNNYKNFPQTAIILYTIYKKCSLFYEKNALILSNQNKVSYWRNNLLEVFAKDWFNFINSLPSFYTNHEKNQVIKSHSLHTGILGVDSLMESKKQGHFNVKEYIKFYKYINASSHEKPLMIILLAYMPYGMLVFLKRLKQKIKSINNKLTGSIDE